MTREVAAKTCIDVFKKIMRAYLLVNQNFLNRFRSYKHKKQRHINELDLKKVLRTYTKADITDDDVRAIFLLMDGHMGKPKIGFVNYMLFYGYFLTYANRKACRPIRGEGAMD